ncbi:MAG: hypothetical protein OCC49_13335 [Fibrobacterales bacterium]
MDTYDYAKSVALMGILSMIFGCLDSNTGSSGISDESSSVMLSSSSIISYSSDNDTDLAAESSYPNSSEDESSSEIVHSDEISSSETVPDTEKESQESIESLESSVEENDESSESLSSEVIVTSSADMGSDEVTFTQSVVDDLFITVGFKGVAGADQALKDSYSGVFGRLDSDNNNLITLEEYIASPMFDETAATGIYNASDRNKDGGITVEEYIENRIITDEAKLIYEASDNNADGSLTREEWVQNSGLDENIAEASFTAFDSDTSGDVTTPEYLVIWGAWARGEL